VQHRVLHVIDHLGVGGAQSLLLSMFKQRVNESDLLLFALRKDPSESATYDPRIKISTNQSRLSMIGPVVDLIKLARHENVTIIHCHLQKSLLIAALLKLFFFKHLPIIYHEHGDILDDKDTGVLSKFVYRALVRIAGFLGIGFIAVSDYTSEQLILRSRIPKDRTKVLHNFTVAESWTDDKLCAQRARIRLQYGISDTTFAVGFVRRIIANKGWAVLLDALQYIPVDRNILVFFAGTGNEQPKLKESIVSRNLSRRVRIIGNVPDAANQFIPGLDCIIVPSFSEAFGLVPLEAFQRNVPVIASNVPGMGEVLRNEINALTFPAGDAQKLAELILQISSDVELQRKLQYNGRLSLNQFSFDSYYDKLQQVYSCFK
jgi:glycosyltransferase involved in cell wall biosynthesis